MERSFFLTHGALKTPCILTIPDGMPVQRIVLGVHGIGGSSQDAIQTGISEVIYHSDKYAETDSVRASKRMFDSAGVTYRKYQPINRLVTIPL
jgi:dCMP deaminase